MIRAYLFIQNIKIIIILAVGFCYGCKSSQSAGNELNIFSLPLLIGEVSQNSAVFQARLTTTDTLIYENIHDPPNLAEADVAGKEGIARFEISDHASFADPVITPWLAASSDMEKNYTKKKNPVETVNVIPV